MQSCFHGALCQRNASPLFYVELRVTDTLDRPMDRIPLALAETTAELASKGRTDKGGL